MKYYIRKQVKPPMRVCSTYWMFKIGLRRYHMETSWPWNRTYVENGNKNYQLNEIYTIRWSSESTTNWLKLYNTIENKYKALTVAKIS